jgi:IS4 transposase
MPVSQAFDMLNQLKPHQVETLTDLLPLELIETDPMRYLVADMADLYVHRWEIELGYRE